MSNHNHNPKRDVVYDDEQMYELLTMRPSASVRTTHLHQTGDEETKRLLSLMGNRNGKFIKSPSSSSSPKIAAKKTTTTSATPSATLKSFDPFNDGVIGGNGGVHAIDNSMNHELRILNDEEKKTNEESRTTSQRQQLESLLHRRRSRRQNETTVPAPAAAPAPAATTKATTATSSNSFNDPWTIQLHDNNNSTGNKTWRSFKSNDATTNTFGGFDGSNHKMNMNTFWESSDDDNDIGFHMKNKSHMEFSAIHSFNGNINSIDNLGMMMPYDNNNFFSTSENPFATTATTTTAAATAAAAATDGMFHTNKPMERGRGGESSSIKPAFAMEFLQKQQKRQQPPPQVEVQASVHEQLSIIIDDVSSTPSTNVTGSIRVKTTKPVRATPSSNFCLTLRDEEGNLEHCEAQEGGACENITSSLTHVALGTNDQVFRVSLRHQERLEAPIASYTCVPRLRPMPLMLKVRVQATDQVCRVTMRIHANPGNPIVLSKASLAMVVPPDVMGESAMMSREGGVWNSMTRLLSWQLGEFEPGHTIEIEAQFDRIVSTHTASTPKFPILIRCDGGAIFSGIQLSADYADNRSTRVHLKPVESSSILYRKV